MRKLTLTAGVAAAAIPGAVGVAQAVTPTTSLKASVSPSKNGTKKKPRNVKLSIELITQPSATDGPFAASDTIVHLGKELVFNGKALKTCSSSQVPADDTKCPKGSKVGQRRCRRHRARPDREPDGDGLQRPGRQQARAAGRRLHAAAIHSVIEGVLSTTRLVRQEARVHVPDTLQQPAPGAYATLTDFKTVVKGTGSKKRPYIGLAGCTKKKLNFQSDFVFTDDTTSTAATTSKCS